VVKREGLDGSEISTKPIFAELASVYINVLPSGVHLIISATPSGTA